MVCVYGVLLYVIYFLFFFFFFLIDSIKPAIAFIQKGHSMFSKICSYTIPVSHRQDAEET